jgi:hypothetical protein
VEASQTITAHTVRFGGEGRNRAVHARFLIKNIRFFPRNCKYFVTTRTNSFRTPLLKVLLKLLLKVSGLTAFAIESASLGIICLTQFRNAPFIYLTELPSALLARIFAHLALAAAAIRARPAALIRRLAGAAAGSIPFRFAHRAF